MADDPDWRYPITVEHGVNLGVDADIERSPDIWPTKEEMTQQPEPEEEPEPPTRHANYPSTTEHQTSGGHHQDLHRRVPDHGGGPILGGTGC